MLVIKSTVMQSGQKIHKQFGKMHLVLISQIGN